MSGNTSIVQSTPGFVSGTFAAKDVRLNTLANSLPGLYDVGDFAVSQRAAGANMSVDIAQGRAIFDPQAATHQGLYSGWRTNATAYNTNADGGYTWTAADGVNPRIDLLCLELKDTAVDASGTTGFRFRIVDGTPNASATHQLLTTYWPAIPTGCIPIAAIRIPAADTTINTAEITNLNPVGAGRRTYSYTAAVETTTSASYTRLTTPDFVCAYVPAHSLFNLFYKSQVKTSVAGTQGFQIYVNDVALSYSSSVGAPAATELLQALPTTYSHAVTSVAQVGADNVQIINSAADVSDVATGQVPSSNGATFGGGYLPIFGLPAGWYVFEMRYKTSANTLSVRERRMIGQVA